MTEYKFNLFKWFKCFWKGHIMESNRTVEECIYQEPGSLVETRYYEVVCCSNCGTQSGEDPIKLIKIVKD